MQSNGNGDVQFFEHTVNHAYNGLVAGHILACALGYTKDYRGVQLLSGLQDSLCPFQVVDVELTNCIMASFCFFQHFCSRY